MIARGMLTCDDRRNYVQKVVFSAAHLNDGAHQDEYRQLLKQRIYRPSYTQNETELRLIRYLGNYARALEAQRLLFADDTVVKLLARIFKQLPSMHNIDIFTGRSYIGGAKLEQSFEGFSAQELNNSGVKTLKSLFMALDEASVRVHRLAFITDKMLCPNNYNGAECDLIRFSLTHIHRFRANFGLLHQDLWWNFAIVQNLPSALSSWLPSSLLCNLREFSLHLDCYYRYLTGGGDHFGSGVKDDLYPGLQNVFQHARSLQRLEFGLNWNSSRHGLENPHTNGLAFGAAFGNAYPTQLKHLELRQCEPVMADDTLKLFRMCAHVLEVVYVEDSSFEYDSWGWILQQLKEYQFPCLKRFNVYDLDGYGRYDAGPYLRGLEARNPLLSEACESDSEAYESLSDD